MIFYKVWCLDDDETSFKSQRKEAKLKSERAELLQKNMQLHGAVGLAGWIRTAWLPYTERLLDELRDAFIDEIVNIYLATHPLDAAGVAHVRMVQLEVEASKPVE